MATVSKVLARTAAATTSTTLYTTPSSTITVVTDILVTNTSTSDVTFTILLDDVSMASSVKIGGNDSYVVSLKQVLNAAKTIKGSASTTAVNFHISGVEIV